MRQIELPDAFAKSARSSLVELICTGSMEGCSWEFIKWFKR